MFRYWFSLFSCKMCDQTMFHRTNSSGSYLVSWRKAAHYWKLYSILKTNGLLSHYWAVCRSLMQINWLSVSQQKVAASIHVSIVPFIRELNPRSLCPVHMSFITWCLDGQKLSSHSLLHGLRRLTRRDFIVSDFSVKGDVFIQWSEPCRDCQRTHITHREVVWMNRVW